MVVTLTWGLIRLAPGNFYSGEKKLPPAVEATIRKKYGLDLPWYQAIRHDDVEYRSRRFWRFAKVSGPVGQRDHPAASAVFGDDRNSRLFARTRDRIDRRNDCRA